LVIVTVYRPVYSQGALSTYQQHKAQLLEEGITKCPRQQLLDDLGQQINEWQSQGHQIIVSGDFNDDVQGSIIKKFSVNTI
jgi:hypothetical protein